MGRCDFQESLHLQQDLREQLLQGKASPTLLFAEHPPTLTLGRRASTKDILWSAQQLHDAKIQVYETPRGGEVTLHAPGQLVIYPIMHVGRNIRAFITLLANAACLVLAELGVPQAVFIQDRPGIWVGKQKIGSVGLHIRQGVSIQGMSINLHVDPHLFSSLIPCGMQADTLANARSFSQHDVSVEQAAQIYARFFASAFATQIKWII